MYISISMRCTRLKLKCGDDFIHTKTDLKSSLYTFYEKYP